VERAILRAAYFWVSPHFVICSDQSRIRRAQIALGALSMGEQTGPGQNPNSRLLWFSIHSPPHDVDPGDLGFSTVSIRKHRFSTDHKKVLHQELGAGCLFAHMILLSVFWKFVSSLHS